MRKLIPPTLIVLTTLFLATTALALNLGELALAANALLTDYEELEPRVDDCTDGTCSEADDLRSELDALEVDRLQVAIDRNAQPAACDCQALGSA